MRFYISNANSKFSLAQHVTKQPVAKRKRIAAPEDEITTTPAASTVPVQTQITTTPVAPTVQTQITTAPVAPTVQTQITTAPVAPTVETEEGHAVTEIDTSDDEQDTLWEKDRGVYYSMQDFVLYLSTVRALESSAGEEYAHYYYSACLEPIPRWCKMVLTAGPSCKLLDKFGGGKWITGLQMDDGKEFIDGTTEKILAAQSALRVAHTRFMMQFKPTFLSKFRLPGAVFDVIVYLTLPCGSDVRFALRDEEGNTESFVSGKGEPSCTVM